MMLKIFKRDETFVALLDKVIYFKAEGHYTMVYYGRDCKTLLPYGLSKMEQKLGETVDDDNPFVKVGRSHIVNIRKVVYASIQKECMTLLGNDGNFMTVHVPKNAIRILIKAMKAQGGFEELESDNADVCGGGKIHNCPYIYEAGKYKTRSKNLLQNKIAFWSADAPFAPHFSCPLLATDALLRRNGASITMQRSLHCHAKEPPLRCKRASVASKRGFMRGIFVAHFACMHA